MKISTLIWETLQSFMYWKWNWKNFLIILFYFLHFWVKWLHIAIIFYFNFFFLVPPKMPKDEPLIYDIGHGSLMLLWRPADVPYYLDEKPVTYTIYVQEPPSMTWRPLYRRIPYTSYHVTNLQPDRDYCFRVQAENVYGLSQPTNAVRLTRLSGNFTP